MIEDYSVVFCFPEENLKYFEVPCEIIKKEDLTKEWMEDNCECVKYKEENEAKRVRWAKKCLKKYPNALYIEIDLEKYEDCFAEQYIDSDVCDEECRCYDELRLCDTPYCEKNCQKYKFGKYIIVK